MEPSGFRIVRYSRKAAEFSIWDISDIHWTNRGISKSHLYRDLEKVRKDTYSLFFQGGDYKDFFREAIKWIEEEKTAKREIKELKIDATRMGRNHHTACLFEMGA